MSAQERRRSEGRRASDRGQRYDRFRAMAATVLAFCGGLSVLYLFFAAIGAVDLADALTATVAAIVLAALWLVGAYQRYRSGGGFVTRPERERRGF